MKSGEVPVTQQEIKLEGVKEREEDVLNLFEYADDMRDGNVIKMWVYLKDENGNAKNMYYEFGLSENDMLNYSETVVNQI